MPLRKSSVPLGKYKFRLDTNHRMDESPSDGHAVNSSSALATTTNGSADLDDDDDDDETASVR